MPVEDNQVPAALMHAVAERRGRIVLVVGAGCSLEEPTGLRLSTYYALEAHRRLVSDGVLEDGECSKPSDLSVLASAVFDKHGTQSQVVERLPRPDFRIARPNSGYLVAAALMRERVVETVMTLNFDLAMTMALAAVGAREVDVVSGPDATAQLGAATVIYLHRNVDELDFERWILRVEALKAEWKEQWEETMARRVMASPVVVFAGLGSPAAVLTETLRRVQAAIPQQHEVFIVDPSESTDFQSDLGLSDDRHIRLGWCEFAKNLANRLVSEMRAEFERSCEEMCSIHGWDDERPWIQALSSRLHALDLVDLGAVRASWLMDPQPYVPDEQRSRMLVADLVLGVGVLERAADAGATFQPNGVVALAAEDGRQGSVFPVSGSGVLRWSALEPRALTAHEALPRRDRPAHILVAGLVGSLPLGFSAPEDLVLGDDSWDIVLGVSRPDIIFVDDLRSDSTLASAVVT